MAELGKETLQRIAELELENERLEIEKQKLYMAVGRLYCERPENYETQLEAQRKQFEDTKEIIRNHYLECLELKGLCICKNCGHEVEKAASFCGECGMRMREPELPDTDNIICERCGARNGKEKKFCTNCGQMLEHSLSEDGAARQSVEKTQSRVCPDCGTELPAGALFCAECGGRL